MTIDELNLLKERITEAEKANEEAERYKKFAKIIDVADSITISKGADNLCLATSNKIDEQIICGIYNLLLGAAIKAREPLVNFDFKQGKENG